jgi:hypothetical protein
MWIIKKKALYRGGKAYLLLSHGTRKPTAWMGTAYYPQKPYLFPTREAAEKTISKKDRQIYKFRVEEVPEPKQRLIRI